MHDKFIFIADIILVLGALFCLIGSFINLHAAFFGDLTKCPTAFRTEVRRSLFNDALKFFIAALLAIFTSWIIW